MTHEACETKLRSVVRSSVHACPGNWVAIGRAVVYYARAARTFSAWIEYWHCSQMDPTSSGSLAFSRHGYVGLFGSLTDISYTIPDGNKSWMTLSTEHPVTFLQ